MIKNIFKLRNQITIFKDEMKFHPAAIITKLGTQTQTLLCIVQRTLRIIKMSLKSLQKTMNNGFRKFLILFKIYKLKFVSSHLSFLEK